MTLNIQSSPWCYFLNSHVEIGTTDVYGRVDDEGRPFVCQASGPEHNAKVPVGFDLSYVYPTRVFVSAEDDDGNPLEWGAIKRVTRDLGIRSFWDEVRSWRGFRAGKIYFEPTLRAETQMGTNMTEIRSILARHPQDGEKLQWWAYNAGFQIWIAT
jgi:hypothetical protein